MNVRTTIVGLVMLGLALAVVPASYAGPGLDGQIHGNGYGYPNPGIYNGFSYGGGYGGYGYNGGYGNYGYGAPTVYNPYNGYYGAGYGNGYDYDRYRRRRRTRNIILGLGAAYLLSRALR
jgi:hypothetical protein